MKERILDFLRYLQIGQSKFEKETGLANGLLNNLKETSGLSSKSINKISSKYPNLNTNWLLTGEGNMLKENNIEQIITNGNNNVVGKNHTIKADDKYYEILLMQQKQMSDMLEVIKTLTETNKNLAST